MSLKKRRNSTSTPYLGVQTYRPPEEWSVREHERVTLDTWGIDGAKETVFLLARIQEIRIAVHPSKANDVQPLMVDGIHVVTTSRHYFYADKEDIKKEFHSYDAIDAHLKHNSIFSVLDKRVITDWNARTRLRPRKEGDEADHKIKQARKDAMKEWKTLERDLRGYLRNMSEEPIRDFIEALEDLRNSLENSIN